MKEDKDFLEAQIKAFKKYLPQRIVEKIVSNPYNIKVEGERKFVSILFGDVSGFTALSERLDPEEVIKVINKYFNKMLYIVDKYGGDVDKFVGDAIMVVFGAPVAHKDDPERAVRAALEMQKAIETIEPVWANGIYVKVRMSIGINTGEIVALNMGTDDRLEYTVMGDNVNLSARLEAVANAGEVIISDRTYKFVKDKFEFEKMEPVKVKGKEKPIQIYKVLSVKKQADGIDYIQPVALKKHFDIIENSIESFLKDSPFYLHIFGEEGTGKSLLIKMLTDKADRKNIKTFYFKGESFSKRIPLGVLQDTLSHILKIQNNDTFENKKNKIDNFISKEFRRGFYYIYQIENNESIERNILIYEIIYSLKHLFQIHKLKSNILLIFDDIHNMDEITQSILLKLTDEIIDDNIPIVISSLLKMKLNESFKVLKTKNLTLKQTKVLIKNILNNMPSEKFLQIIFEKTKGNPRHIIALINYLKDNKKLTLKNSVIDSVLRDTSMLPDNIKSIFIEQLDNLPEKYKQFLQYVSILGDSFNKELIEGIYHYKMSDIDECVKFLMDKGFIIYRGNGIYEFKTSLFRNAVYSSLMKNRRKELHKTTANYLRENYLQINRNIITDIAYHYDNSEDIENAPKYLELSGDIKRRVYMNNNAIDDYMRAAYYYKLNNKFDKYNKSILRSLIVYIDISDFDKAEELLKSNKSFLIKDKKQQATYYNYMGIIRERRGDIKNAIQFYKKGLKTAEIIKNEELLSSIYNQLGVLFLNSGDLKSAEDYFIKALNKSIRLKNAKDIAVQYVNLSRVSIYKREFDKAKNYLQKAIDIQEENDFYEGLMISYLNLAVVYGAMGQMSKVRKLYEKTISIGEKTGNRLIMMKALNNIAVLDFQAGDYDKAINGFLKLKKEAEIIKDITMLSEVMGNMAELKASIGAYSEAIELFEKCFDYANKINHLHLIGYERINYANILILLGYLQKAETVINENIKLSIEIQNNDYLLMSKDLQAKIQGIINNIEDEINILKDAYEKAKEMNNVELMMKINSTLVKGLIKSGEYEKAEKIANDVIDLLKKVPDLNIKSDILVSLSDIYVSKKQYEKLALISQDTYDLIQKIKNALSLLRMTIVLSWFYYSVKDFTSMENELKIGEQKAKQMNVPEYLILIYQLYEKLYSENNDKNLIFDIKTKMINTLNLYIENAGKYSNDLIYKRKFGNYYKEYIEFLFENYDKSILMDNIKTLNKSVKKFLKKELSDNLKKYIK